MSLLVLCTGNLCRSPMAEALLRQRAELSGAPLDVTSAGFAAEGQTSPRGTLAAMRRRAIDLSEHRSRMVSAAQLDEADLVIGMTRAHVWEAAIQSPDVVPRAFVLGELVRLNHDIGRRAIGEPLGSWRSRLHSERKHGAQHPRIEDEIADPMGHGGRFHERIARQIERLILELSDCAFDPLYSFSEMRWREGKLVWRATPTPLAGP